MLLLTGVGSKLSMMNGQCAFMLLRQSRKTQPYESDKYSTGNGKNALCSFMWLIWFMHNTHSLIVTVAKLGHSVWQWAMTSSQQVQLYSCLELAFHLKTVGYWWHSALSAFHMNLFGIWAASHTHPIPTQPSFGCTVFHVFLQMEKKSRTMKWSWWTWIQNIWEYRYVLSAAMSKYCW